MGRTTTDLLEALPAYLDECARTYHHAVIEYFRRRSTEIATIDDLVPFVRDEFQSEADETEIAIYLHHVALPRLATCERIDYDERTNTVRYRGSPTEIEIPTDQCG